MTVFAVISFVLKDVARTKCHKPSNSEFSSVEDLYMQDTVCKVESTQLTAVND